MPSMYYNAKSLALPLHFHVAFIAGMLPGFAWRGCGSFPDEEEVKGFTTIVGNMVKSMVTTTYAQAITNIRKNVQWL